MPPVRPFQPSSSSQNFIFTLSLPQASNFVPFLLPDLLLENFTKNFHHSVTYSTLAHSMNPKLYSQWFSGHFSIHQIWILSLNKQHDSMYLRTLTLILSMLLSQPSLLEFSFFNLVVNASVTCLMRISRSCISYCSFASIFSFFMFYCLSCSSNSSCFDISLLRISLFDESVPAASSKSCSICFI